MTKYWLAYMFWPLFHWPGPQPTWTFQYAGFGLCFFLILFLDLGQGPEMVVWPLTLGHICSTKGNWGCHRHCLLPSLSLTLVPVCSPHPFYPQFTPTPPHHKVAALRPPTDFLSIAECLQCRATFTPVRGYRRARNQSLVSRHLITYLSQKRYQMFVGTYLFLFSLS